MSYKIPSILPYSAKNSHFSRAVAFSIFHASNRLKLIKSVGVIASYLAHSRFPGTYFVQ